jgi:DNA-binding NtrC family response regulator
LEQNRTICSEVLKSYLPAKGTRNLPAIVKSSKSESDFSSEREILYKVLFDMKSDLNDLKKLTMELMKNGNSKDVEKENEHLIQKIYGDSDNDNIANDFTFEEEAIVENPEVLSIPEHINTTPTDDKYHFAEEIEEEETLSLHDKELELIKKSLERHKGKRKLAASELGISERTLYRKIKQYDL